MGVELTPLVPPDHELECYRALADALPGHRFRYDPNAALSVADAVRFGKAIEDVDNDYFEDPTYGLEGMRRLRRFVDIPTATNTVVVNFEQLAACIRTEAIDVILLDTTFWGGIRPCIKAAGVCETFQLGVAVHSSGELGVQLATMLHLGAVGGDEHLVLALRADERLRHLHVGVRERRLGPETVLDLLGQGNGERVALPSDAGRPTIPWTIPLPDISVRRDRAEARSTRP